MQVTPESLVTFSGRNQHIL